MVAVHPTARAAGVPSAPWWRIPHEPAAPRPAPIAARPRPDRAAGGDDPAAALGEAALFWFFGGRRPHSGDRGGAAALSRDVAAAAQRLGLGPRATQAEIDRRFREIIKHERPDLGEMPVDGFAGLAEARRTLRDEAVRAQHAAVRQRYELPGPAIGTLVDRRG